MRKTLLLMAFIAMLASCKKKTTNEITPETKTEELSKDINVYITGFIRFTDPAPQGNGIYSFLGYGYDVTDKYNSEVSVRSNVIDMSTFVAANPGRFDLGRSARNDFVSKTAIDAEDFSRQLSDEFAATRGLKLFGNTVVSSFDLWPLSNKDVYAYYSKVIERKRLKINYNSTSGHLSSNFVRDLASLTPASLVNRYGTHVLKDIMLGASFNVIYKASTIGGNRKKISATGLRYTLAKGFELFNEELDPLDLAALNANKNAYVYYEAAGGDLSKLPFGSKSKMPFFSINDWLSSVTEEKSKFIGIAENGLIPLEDLITDPQKKAEVKAYIAQYIKEKSVKIEN